MKLEPKMPHFQGAKNYKENRRFSAEYWAANGVERTKKLPLSARRRAVAWKRFEHGVPLHIAEARYLESAYLEEWAAEFGPY
jgi:hypothetical protein